MSRTRTALAVSALLLISSCAKHADSCRAARTGARNAWSAYVAALERSKTAAIAAQNEAQARLSGELEQRFAPIAEQVADQHHPRGSEAWSSAYRVAHDAACARDDDCRAWKEARAAAAATLADLVRRLPPALAARAAVNGDPAHLAAAATAVLADPEYPQLEQAQQLARDASAQCKD